MKEFSEEWSVWCLEMLRRLVREERDQGRLTEEESGRLFVYLSSATLPPFYGD